MCLKYEYISFYFFVLLFKNVYCYFDVQVTLGKALNPDDTETINLNNLRVKRLNKTEYQIIGEFETYKELTNDYEVGKYTYTDIQKSFKPNKTQNSL